VKAPETRLELWPEVVRCCYYPIHL